MSLKSTGLKTHIWNNNLLSVAMLFVLPITLLMMVWTSVFSWHLAYPEGLLATKMPEYNWELLTAIYHRSLSSTLYALPFVLIIVAIWYVLAWSLNSQIIRGVTRSKKLTRQQEPKLFNLLENLSISRGITMPQLCIIETNGLNAFASGIDKESYTITVTRGLLDNLKRDEIEAVLAHELSHIENNDVRLMVIITIFSGFISTIFSFLTLPFTAKVTVLTEDGESEESAPFFAIFFVTIGLTFLLISGTITAVISSFVTKLIKLFISRKREYVADAGAIEITKNPAAMVRALRKIEQNAIIPNMPKILAEMCIAKPHQKEFLATHPTTELRVQALKNFAGYGLDEKDYRVGSIKQTVKKTVLNSDFGLSATPREPDMPYGFLLGIEAKAQDSDQQSDRMSAFLTQTNPAFRDQMLLQASDDMQKLAQTNAVKSAQEEVWLVGTPQTAIDDYYERKAKREKQEAEQREHAAAINMMNQFGNDSTGKKSQAERDLLDPATHFNMMSMIEKFKKEKYGDTPNKGKGKKLKERALEILPVLPILPPLGGFGKRKKS